MLVTTSSTSVEVAALHDRVEDLHGAVAAEPGKLGHTVAALAQRLGDLDAGVSWLTMRTVATP